MLDLSAAVPGSPLLARQNFTLIYGLIFLTAFAVCLLLLLWFMLKTFHRHATPEWMAAQKNKPTRLSNINNVANKYRLTKDERNLLWEICRKNNTPNIEYLLHDENAVNELFRVEYTALTNGSNPEPAVSTLFFLRYKLERARASATIITSSKSIPEGTAVSYIDTRDRRHILQLVQNTKEGMCLQMPGTFSTMTDKPAALSKIDLVFTLPSGMQYTMNTRLVRYQTGLSGQPEMFVTHTNNVIPFSKRQTKRIVINQKCIFAAVKVGTRKKGNSETVTYEPLEHQYEGILADISSGGCQIVTRLPIKVDQYIWIELKMNSEHNDEAIGLIVNTKKNMENDLYNLHIKFIKISMAAQNRIWARVYNYTA